MSPELWTELGWVCDGSAVLVIIAVGVSVAKVIRWLW
jgi:hypothetical protein